MTLIYIKNRCRKKNDDKDWKSLQKLMNNLIYSKTIRYSANLKLASSKKEYLKLMDFHATKNNWKQFGSDSERKVTLLLNKLEYVGICMLGLSKVWMYEFNYESYLLVLVV